MIQSTNSSLFNAEDVNELRQLTDQATFVTQGMGELLSEEPSGFHDVLDLGCGPGEWVLSLAQHYPNMHVVGIDINPKKIAYAQAQAEAAHLHNATFQRMSAMQLPIGYDLPTLNSFADASFDLINARFFGTFIPKKTWLEVTQQCYRLLRPGGALQLTDHALASTNSPAFDEWLELIYQAQLKRGQKRSKSESAVIMLYSLLEEGGFQIAGQKPYAIDFSAGREVHDTMSTVLLSEIASNRFLLVDKMALITAKEHDGLEKRLFEEFCSPEFKGIWFLFTVRGRKP